MASPFAGNPFAGSFGVFQTAVNDSQVRATPGGVQMYVWQSLTNEYAGRGETLPRGAFAAVNQLLGLAGRQRRAEQELGRARLTMEETGLDQAVTGSMIAPHLDSRPLSEQVAGAQYRVVYLTQELVDGDPVLSYRTHDFGYDLPQSLGGLQAEVDMSAQLLAADYGYEWGGVATPVAIHSY